MLLFSSLLLLLCKSDSSCRSSRRSCCGGAGGKLNTKDLSLGLLLFSLLVLLSRGDWLLKLLTRFNGLSMEQRKGKDNQNKVIVKVIVDEA